MTCQCKTKTVRQPVVTSDTRAMNVTSTTVCTACQTAHATCNIIDGFLSRQHELNLNQRRKVQDIARRLVASSVFRKSPTIIIRLTAHLDGVEFRSSRFELARRRANAVVRHLKQAIEVVSPEASNRIQFIVSIAQKFTPLSIDALKNRRVEICLPQEKAAQMSVNTLSKPRTSLTIIRDSRLVFKNKLRENEWQEMNEFEYGGSSVAAPIRSPVINFPHDGVSLATMNPRLNCNVAGSNALQMKLDNLMNTTYPKFKNKVKIALVNMSGRAATACPSFAALNENENFFGASTPKIAPLYALFQLKFELENLLRTTPSIVNIANLEKEMYLKWASVKGLGTKPKISRLFQLRSKTLSFKPDIQAILDNFSHTNSGVSKIISLVGYAYTGSLMVASGLFEPKPTLKNKRYGEGLWLMSSYGKYIGTWGSSPFGGLGGGTQNITAKSVATFFTLLAQNKLANSNDIKITLSNGGCVIWGGVPNIVASKCGYYSTYKIDAFLHDDGAGKKFVLSLLTKGLTQKEYLNFRASIISLF
jgi:hypothetical protein